MEVKDFINETVSQILESVEDLNAKYSNKGASIASVGDFNYRGVWMNQYVAEVDFDIALEVVTDKTTGVGGKLGVASIIGAGADKATRKQDQSISKVHFTLPVMFPELDN